jgi:HSP20 family protein
MTPGYDLSVASRREIDRLRSELEDLFDQMWSGPRFAARHCFRPQVDCFRTEEPPEYVVVIELAGIDPENVQVIAADQLLVVAGERRRPKRGKGGQVYQQMEIDYGRFERRVPLPEDVQTEDATATYEQGLLKIVFPTAARPSPAPRVPIPIRRER